MKMKKKIYINGKKEEKRKEQSEKGRGGEQQLLPIWPALPCPIPSHSSLPLLPSLAISLWIYFNFLVFWFLRFFLLLDFWNLLIQKLKNLRKILNKKKIDMVFFVDSWHNSVVCFFDMSSTWLTLFQKFIISKNNILKSHIIGMSAPLSLPRLQN